ncbi:MAG: RHS repeat-associated core domain-containing protein, partial [Candidatus Onthovivens sp.]|nr:RHS repeat-associated core domain-containing protein [Candidatus Onthovivens sp.]
GAYLVNYSYDDRGQPTITSNNNEIGNLLAQKNCILYTGYLYDFETQLYWVYSRYYSPELCRWISPDSIEYLDLGGINGLNLYAYCGNNPINRFDPIGHSWESFWNGVGDWFEDHWLELTVGTAFIIGGAVVTALTCGTGTTAWAAFGSALLSSTIQVGAGIGISVLFNGASNLIQGNEFFDNVGDTIASAYMLGGILSGGSQMLSGGFRFLKVKTGFKGINSNNFGFMSPDGLYHKKPGMTVLRVGSRKGVKLAIDFGKYGIHGHIWKWPTHIPLIPGIVGISEQFKRRRKYENTCNF